MSERRLDEAIDRTVREMMSLDPRAGLSRRVLAGLETPRTGWVTVPRRAAAAVLIAGAIVGGWLVTRTPAPVQQQVSVAHAPVLPRAQSEARVSRRSAHTAPVERYVPRSARALRRPQVTPENIPPFLSNVHIEPLASIAAIAVEPAGPRALESPEVNVTPLAPIEPVRVDPLPSRPR